jgi:glycosyltransferase involved in cell wall biosynthesis
MLSICIPQYNFDVNPLVSQLNHQISTLDIDTEIIVLDDGSSLRFPILDNGRVLFERIETNAGRSKSRNRLAEMAKYENLLFLDCDSMAVSTTFLKDYIKATKSADVICGGTAYQTNDTTNLRIQFGIKRETINKKGSFFSNNFFIKKSVFESIKFDESITEYGHEDTIFGIQLLEKGFKIDNIDNPVFHTGIETNAIFLSKVEKSIDTLLKIQLKYPQIGKTTSILKVSNRLQNTGVANLFRNLIHPFIPTIKQNLLGKSPRLIFLDLYKLHYILTVSSKL